ncbi:hypothetical protein DEAC_c00020 [Desulfosporosinus acididurans]|uniref:Uncharacterized protein n=1 Tax=Desulfosporosinus acididurans TaxID=476652 RepID=A0A0J1FX83_9FIRM|nr:hypothetical protein [Desulfosporosinus acididurans]KLU67608.1 hypothetical protein DEAC_c00020 [Desulfosporosinus acididurans]
MSGRCYTLHNGNKKLNGNFNTAIRGTTAAVIYLKTSNNYNAKEDQDDRKKAIISVSIICTFLFFLTTLVMVANIN